MTPTLLKALPVLALVMVSVSVVAVRRTHSRWHVVQLVGAIGFTIVGVAHIAEARQLVPVMGWGSPSSVGHYLDLASMTLGVTLFPAGYVFGRAARRTTTQP